MLFIVIINALICPLPQPLRFPGYCISHNLSSNIGSAIIVSLAYCLSPQYFFVLTLALFECHRLLWIPLQVMLCFHYQSQNQWHSCVSLNYDLLLLWRHKFLVIISSVNDIGCWKNKEGRDYKSSDSVKISTIIQDPTTYCDQSGAFWPKFE